MCRLRRSLSSRWLVITRHVPSSAQVCNANDMAEHENSGVRLESRTSTRKLCAYAIRGIFILYMIRTSRSSTAYPSQPGRLQSMLDTHPGSICSCSTRTVSLRQLGTSTLSSKLPIEACVCSGSRRQRLSGRLTSHVARLIDFGHPHAVNACWICALTGHEAADLILTGFSNISSGKPSARVIGHKYITSLEPANKRLKVNAWNGMPQSSRPWTI